MCDTPATCDNPANGGCGPRRGGVLLLIVLIALTLFLMLGMAMLVNATNSRTAARGFGSRTDQQEAYTDRAGLDEALMTLLRGSRTTLPPQIGESILADRYGAGTDTIETAVPSLAGWPAEPILTATVAGNPQLNGRVLTLAPVSPGDGDVLSFRIIGAGGGRLYLANWPARPGRVLPTGTCRWLVNGRDFAGPFPANEAWDGFTTGSAAGTGDMSDPWLARVELAAGAVSVVRQATYQSVADPAVQPLALECDNDNDGVPDGVWISGTAGFLAPRPSPRGGVISQRVSYLVLDLDGRLNVNAVGMARPGSGSYANSPDVPLGMGYGPADIDGSLLFPATSPPATGLSAYAGAGANPSGMWWNMLAGGSSSTAVATAGQRRPPPGIGSFDGRYGANRVPGGSGDDQNPLQVTAQDRYAAAVAGANAVGDLQGRARMYMTATVATLPGASLTPTLTWFLPTAATDATDDPYEVRLDAAAPRLGGGAWSGTAAATSVNDDMPFTFGELERVLRANDPDAALLAQRLAAALAASSQASRLLITTDSWDTPALTGPAAMLVHNELAARPPTYGPWADANTWSPDVAAGLRFDINRPVLAGRSAAAVAQQQEFCKGLYTLARTLGENDARRAAQWAVNVLDFRDEDSTMTRFVYDTDLRDGWSVTGATTGTVWGVERPDLLIADTAAWRSPLSGSAAMFAGVVRAPFNAQRVAAGGTTAAELPDPVLRVSGTTWLNARATGGTSSVWQLRLSATGTDLAVAFRPVTGSASMTQSIVVNGTVSGTLTQVVGLAAGVGGVKGLATSGSESMVVIAGASAPGVVASSSPPQMLVDQGGTFAPVGPGVSGTLRLERLADPNRDNAADNPYIVVDMAPYTVSTAGDTADEGITQRLRRPGPRDGGGGHPLAAFWRQPESWQPDGKQFRLYHETAGMFHSGTTDPVPWFHWPNRPYVSQAELALVPAEDANGMLRAYSFPTTSLVNGPVGRHILDATIVPTRFAGNGITFTRGGTVADRLRDVGLNLLVSGATEAGRMGGWREPGRMNVNTLPTGTSGATDGLLWQLLAGGTQTVLTSGTVSANPFTATGTISPAPARSPAHVVALTAGDAVAVESIPALAASGTLHPRAKNPFFAIAVANRLANTTTVRSNVFAVWITVETTDSSPGAPPPVTRRLFAIIDRSVPVGYSQGEDLNVRDTIRLLRQLD